MTRICWGCLHDHHSAAIRHRLMSEACVQYSIVFWGCLFLRAVSHSVGVISATVCITSQNHIENLLPGSVVALPADSPLLGRLALLK